MIKSIVLIAFVLFGMTSAHACSCPPETVCVPRSVARQMPPDDIAMAKEKARSMGVRWKITETKGQHRRSLKCESSSQC